MRGRIEHSRVAGRFPLGKISEALSRVSDTEKVTSGYLVNEPETSINPFASEIHLSSLFPIIKGKAISSF